MSPATTPVTSVLGQARSFLFLPADRLERLDKALASSADALVIDLEDAVASEAKAPARQGLARRWPALNASARARIVLRVNAATSPWHAEDLALLAQLPGLGAVMLAKAECPDALSRLAQALPGLPLLPLVESARGLQRVQALADSAQVLRLAIGHVDLQLDLGLPADGDAAILGPARWSLVLASRCAELPAPIDGVSLEIHDRESVLAAARRSRRTGFTGKLCIHPAQLDPVHQGLAPTEAELVWAQRVLAAVAAARGRVGAGALQLDGRLIDAPVEAQARRLLALAGQPLHGPD